MASTPAAKAPVEIRADLVRVLRQDRVGPEPGEPYETEALTQPPSQLPVASA